MTDWTFWDDAKIQRLRKMWAEGYTSQQIGDALGVSKNSALGKVHRLKLEPRPSPIKPTGTPKPTRHHRKRPAPLPVLVSMAMPKHVNGKRTASPASIPAPQRDPVAPPMVRHPSPIPTLSSKPCCWPMWNGRIITHEFCGQRGVPGKPYCPEHCKEAYIQWHGGDMAPWIRRDQGLKVVE